MKQTAFSTGCISNIVVGRLRILVRSAAMRDHVFRVHWGSASLVAVIGLVASLALLICPFAAPVTTPVLRILADREFNPPHSLRSRFLSLGFQPIGFVLEFG